MHPLWWADCNITELTVPLPKYLVQQDSFFSDTSLQDVTSFSGVWLLFLETALVFQETFLRSNCSILCLCSWRLCSSSWILICQETVFFFKHIERTEFNREQLETHPECKPTFIQKTLKGRKKKYICLPFLVSLLLDSWNKSPHKIQKNNRTGAIERKCLYSW